MGYFAENTVTLTPGFHAIAGVQFSAKIVPCPTDFTNSSNLATFATPYFPPPIIPTIKNTFIVYPNPFQSSTTLAFNLAQPANVQLVIFDATGSTVQTLVNNQPMDRGQHELLFRSELLKNGLYIARLQVGQTVLSKKMVLLER